MKIDLGGILEQVQDELRDRGISIDLSDAVKTAVETDGDSKIKVVCVTPDLKDSVREMGKVSRDQVVMVRVDAATSETLDAWVATGAVKSRSEAAALFIREGLRVRADELERLKDALAEVEKAKEKLRRKAKDVFGSDEGPDQD